MNLNVTTSRSTGTQAMVIAIEGELDLSTIDRVGPAAHEAIAAQRPVVFDLSRCTFLDSSALRLLLQVYGALKAADLDVPMAIVVGDSPVHKVLALTDIDQGIPMLPTLEAATGRTLRDGKAIRFDGYSTKQEALEAAGLREYAMS